MAPNLSAVNAILKDEFSIYPGKSISYDVYLHENRIEYCRRAGPNCSDKQVVIDFVDVVGCHCFEERDRVSLNKKRPKNEEINVAFFCLYYYPRCNDVRQRQVIVFRVNRYETFDENLGIAKRWRTAILHILRGGVTLRNGEDVENLSVPRRRKMLVFVNPYSGTRRAEPIFRNKVQPIFNEADIDSKLIITERQLHAKEFVETEDLNPYNGIVIISGDGLVYEVLNGLMARNDRQEALKIPLGIVPGGSGNALTACVLSAERDSYRKNAILHSAFTIAKGGSQPMDLVRVQTPSISSYSFLCISWAMISDIDIESERFRSLGPIRFALGAFVRTICLRRYKGRLSYLPVKDTTRYEEHFSKPLQQVKNDFMQTNLLSAYSKSLPSLDSTEPRLICARPLNKTITTSPSFPSSLPNQYSSNNSLSDLSQIKEEETRRVNGTQHSVDDRANGVAPTNNCSTNNANCERTLLSPVDEPVPNDWVTIEGEFVGFCAVYTSHISQDAFMWPGRKSDEGVISIQYVMSPLSRKSVACLLLGFDDASHTQSDILRTVFAEAFRLESLEPDRGILTIDGEALEKGTRCIQAEVIQRKFQIIRPGNGASSP